MRSSKYLGSRGSLRRALCSSLRVAPICVLALGMSVTAPAQGTGYWHTSGNQIVDAAGKQVRIAGINWYGFETTDQVAHGLYDQDYHEILNTIHTLGYNAIRLPFSNQMVEHPIVSTGISPTNSAGPINSDLAGLNSLQVMDKIVAAAGVLGIKVILDNHRSEAGNSNEPSGLWYTAAYPEAKWIADWEILAARYKSVVDGKGNPVVIGMDLRNEPHLLVTLAQAGPARTGSCWTGDSWTNGCPATDTAQNWPAAAERAAKGILGINPNLLIFVEGTDCYSGDCGWQGANLEGAQKYPIVLPVAERLVYSAHDYGPDLDKQAWFSPSTTSASLKATWTKYWAYLSTGGIAPVWVGEFGTTNVSTDVESNVAGSQGQWFSALITFLANEPNIDWTYWALNGEDTFGLLTSAYGTTPPSSLKQQMLASLEFTLNSVGGAPPCAASTAAPAGVTATANGSSSIVLGWNAVAAPANCAVTYNVYRATVAGFIASSANLVSSGMTAASYVDANLKAATTYYYRVDAVDAHGSSAVSAQVSAKTSTAVSGAACHVVYQVPGTWAGGFQTAITIQNTGTTALTSWKLTWSFANGQKLTSVWNALATQSGALVTLTSESYNAAIAAGGSAGGIGFTASAGSTNAVPAIFAVNGIVCR